MSNSEVAPESSPEFSYVMPALANGSSVSPGIIPNYNGATSQIIGVTLVSAGAGISGPVFALQGGILSNSVGPVSGRPTITLSEVGVAGLDVSTYRVHWVNKVAQSQLATVLKC